VIGFQSTHRDIFLPAYLSVYPEAYNYMGSSISSKRNVKMKMDAVDASLLVLNTMSAFLIVGIGKFDLFGVDFAATLFSPAGFGPVDGVGNWIRGNYHNDSYKRQRGTEFAGKRHQELR